MKDNLQNISDLIGALAEDIEEIKKILAAKDASDKDEAVKRLAVKLEPVIRFFGGSTPENINGIFRSKETIEAYKKSLGGEMIVSLQEYTDANDKNMRERGIPTTKDLLYKILKCLLTMWRKTNRFHKRHSKSKASHGNFVKLSTFTKLQAEFGGYGTKYPMAGTRILTHGLASLVHSYSLPCLPPVGCDGMNTGRKTSG